MLEAAKEKAVLDKKNVELDLVRLRSTVSMIGMQLLSFLDGDSICIENDLVEKELALAEAQSMLEQSKDDLVSATKEAALALTYKREVDELTIYLQEYQAKANNKVIMSPHTKLVVNSFRFPFCNRILPRQRTRSNILMLN